VLLQQGNEVAAQYRASGTPTGYLIDEEGRIASPLAVGAQALLDLADGPPSPPPPSAQVTGPQSWGERAVPVLTEPNRNGHGRKVGTRDLSRSKIRRDGLEPGTPAPDFNLPRLDGGELSLSQFRGRKVLLVFSDPHCGPCEALLPQLQEALGDRPLRGHPRWALAQTESRPKAQGPTPNVQPQVLVVSRGEAEENRRKVRQQRLTLPVALQKQWEVSRRYAMFATPIAYLIDEQGRIAHDVAIGVEPILALARDAASTANGRKEARRAEAVALRR
jgi:peroxiredoxin